MNQINRAPFLQNMLFNKLHSPSGVSSTPCVYFDSQLSARQRYFRGESDAWFTSNTHFGKRIRHRAQIWLWFLGERNGNSLCKIVRFIYTRCTFEKSRVVSSMPNASCFLKKASRTPRPSHSDRSSIRSKLRDAPTTLITAGASDAALLYATHATRLHGAVFQSRWVSCV